MENQREILVVLPRFPFPTDKGDRLRIYYQLIELSKVYKVHLVCVDDKPTKPEHYAHIESICESVKVFYLTKAQVIWNIMLGFFSTVPFQTYYFRSNQAKKHITEMLASGQIAICYVQLVRSFLNVPFFPDGKYYLDYMDAFSLGMAKRGKKSGVLKKTVFNLESKRLIKFEKLMGRFFDGFSIITSQDAKGIKDALPVPLDIVPNGISDSFFAEPEENRMYDVVFLGHMKYYPNIQASIYLCEEVLPLLMKEHPGTKVCLLGMSPGPEILKYESDHVTVTGFVPSVTDYLVKSKMFVAPLFTGQGLQNKILEAMAAQLPVVTTPLAYSAFEKGESSGIKVADSAQAFAKEIDALLKDPEELKRLGLQGRDFVKEQYDWAQATSVLVDRFEQIIHEQHGKYRTRQY